MLLLVVVVGPAASAFEAPPAQQPFPAFDAQSLRIELERGACFGNCPVYRITILGSGEVLYEGRSSVLVPGAHRARIGPDSVAALVARFREARFFSLRDSYFNENVADMPEYRLSFSMGGRTKTIVDYVGREVGMPAAVEELEQEIDRAAGAMRWVAGNADTVPALQAEGFDFRSELAAAMLVGAAAQANLDLVDALLLAGVSPTAAVGGVGALEAATSSGHFATWNRLFRAGALAGGDRAGANRVAEAAATVGHPQILRALLPLGFDANGPDGAPLLMEAIGRECSVTECDRLEAVRVLLAAGADPNRSNRYGSTALFYAEDIETARLLLDAGADPNRRNGEGETAIMGLVETNENLALFLLDRGADPSIRSEFGETLVDKARANRWTRVLARLARD